MEHRPSKNISGLVFFCKKFLSLYSWLLHLERGSCLLRCFSWLIIFIVGLCNNAFWYVVWASCHIAGNPHVLVKVQSFSLSTLLGGTDPKIFVWSVFFFFVVVVSFSAICSWRVVSHNMAHHSLQHPTDNYLRPVYCRLVSVGGAPEQATRCNWHHLAFALG